MNISLVSSMSSRIGRARDALRKGGGRGMEGTADRPRGYCIIRDDAISLLSWGKNKELYVISYLASTLPAEEDKGPKA